MGPDRRRPPCPDLPSPRACESFVSRQNARIDRNQIESELAQLEQELERVTQLAEESDAALAALEEERVEREGRLVLAQRAKDDFKLRIEAKRLELQRAEARTCSAHSADYIEWKQLTDTLREDIALLQSTSP